MLFSFFFLLLLVFFLAVFFEIQEVNKLSRIKNFTKSAFVVVLVNVKKSNRPANKLAVIADSSSSSSSQ
jgi:uncharacterized BrkB/YihY/UPF0761 family membrane protein